MHEILGGFEFILRGGFMMYPLLLSALIALAVIFERLYMLNNRYGTPRGLQTQVSEMVRAGKLTEAGDICRKQDSPVAAVLAAGLDHFDDSPEEMEITMQNRAEEWIPRLERRIDIIDTVITAAPLMGLLGTITGMMASFRVLSEKGVNEPNAITGGVAEALIATATGLVIALVCLVAYNYLTSRVKYFIYEIETASSRLTELHHAAQRKLRAPAK